MRERTGGRSLSAGWCRVGSFADRGGASLALTVLEDAGIAGRLEADDAGGTSPDLLLITGGVQLVVPAPQVDDAHAILDRLSWQRSERAASHDDAPPRTRRIGERGVSVVVLVLVASLAMAGLLHTF